MNAIEFKELTYRYENTDTQVFPAFSLSVPLASRILLLGGNGVGKSTLLRILAGRHLVPESAVHVLGLSPFFGLSLASEIALIDIDFPVTLDLRVHEMLGHKTFDQKREAELIDLLGVDPDWRMNRVSEGQRRRVQLLLSLRKPVKLLLLDEVTAHLDVVMRADLIAWLREQSLKTGLTTVYATHILDGLWTSRETGWPTHILSMKFSEAPKITPVREIPSLMTGGFSPLLSWFERELREDLHRQTVNATSIKK